MSIETIAVISFILLALCLIPISLFIIYYAARSDWTANRVGRIVMGKTISIWGIIALTVWVNLSGGAPLGGVLIIGVPLLVLISYSMQFVSLLKIQSGNEEEIFADPWWTRLNRWIRGKLAR